MKKKSFLLLEALIAISILAFIVSFGLSLLTSQVKNNYHFQKFKKVFYENVILKKDIKEIFYHLKVDKKNCLATKDDKIVVWIDAGAFLNPAISGTQQAQLYVKQKNLVLDFIQEEKVLFEKVLANQVDRFDVWFFDPEKNWQKIWNPKTGALPEMIKIELIANKKNVHWSFLLPANLKPIKPACS